jgi:ornithine cyclodeaminase/alanine dehydrogenase-like protein (mu-crystallin family)
VLALNKADLKALVPMRQAVELMKVAFQELSAGRAQAPLRSVVEVNDDPSAMLMMPGFVPASSALGFKMVSFFAGNPKRNLPTIHALVCLVDADSGLPLGIMEGGFVTALRTGAVSGAATDLLARPDSKTVAVIGAGVQGVTQALAVASVRPIERIIAVDVRDDSLQRYRETVNQEWPEIAGMVETTSNVQEAVKAADVICTATTARKAVFDDADVRPGTHINAVGAFTPEMQEIPVETVGRALIVIDNHGAIMAEAGDLLKGIEAGVISDDDLRLELGHVVADGSLGRQSAEQVTLFKSVGNAVQDVVVARYAIDQATAQGRGQQIDLF